MDILNPGERVLWEGTCRSRMGRQNKACPILGSRNYLILGFAVLFIGVSVNAATDSGLAGLLASGLVLAIAGLAWGTIQNRVRDSDMYCRKETRYLITNQRAVVLRNCRTRRPLQSLPWGFVDEVRTEQMRTDGRGTVQFLGWDAVAMRQTQAAAVFHGWERGSGGGTGEVGAGRRTGMIDFAREVDSMVSGALNPGEEVIWTGHCLSRIGQQRKAKPHSSCWAWLFAVPLIAVGAMHVCYVIAHQ